MTAPVRIESEAWGDPRYAVLASLCGLAQPRFALILCASIWSYCTDRNESVLSAQLIDALAGVPNFAEHMRNAELAEKVRGGYRIRGAAGRIEWLHEKRKAGAKGGKNSANRRAQNTDGAQAELKQNSSTPQAVLEHPLDSPPSTTQPSYSALLCSSSAQEEFTHNARETVPDPEPGEPPPQTPLPEVIRQGYRRRYHAALQSYPAESHSKAVAKLTDWCCDNAQNHRTTAAALAERVLDGLFRSPSAADKRFPLAYAAHDPLEYLGVKPEARKPPASAKLRAELEKIETQLRSAARDSWEHTDLSNKRAELLTRIHRAEAAA